MKGGLLLLPEIQYIRCNLSMGQEKDKYVLVIHTDLSKKYEELFPDITADLENNIDYALEFSDDDESIEFYKYAKNNIQEIFENIEYVTIGFDFDEAAKYIKENPILKTKKIIFTDMYELNPETIEKIEKEFGNETSNFYFSVAGNTNYISFEEYKATIEAIDKKFQEINRLNLSPMEKIMYAYDLSRDRVYEEVDEGDDKLNSRDLSSVLLGDKIVCVGYSRIFITLLEKLGIPARRISLRNKENTGGHARVEAYVKDEKYGIDGVYYFDPTWDCKRNDDSDNYLLSYRFFAMTKSNMDELDNGHIVDSSFPYFSPDIAWEFEEQVDEKGFLGLSQEMIKSINHMSTMIDDDVLINKVGLMPDAPKCFKPDKEKIISRLMDLVEYFDAPLSADTLLKVLYNVRKNQYYLNPEKYDFSLVYFFTVAVRSEWEFEDNEFNPLLLAMLGPDELMKVKAHQIRKYSKETDLEKNIERVKLAKVLRRVCDKKRNNNQ